jgi:hypothetical protein
MKRICLMVFFSTSVVARTVGNLVAVAVGIMGWVGGVGLGCVKIDEDYRKWT